MVRRAALGGQNSYSLERPTARGAPEATAEAEGAAIKGPEVAAPTKADQRMRGMQVR